MPYSELSTVPNNFSTVWEVNRQYAAERLALKPSPCSETSSADPEIVWWVAILPEHSKKNMKEFKNRAKNIFFKKSRKYGHEAEQLWHT